MDLKNNCIKNKITVPGMVLFFLLQIAGAYPEEQESTARNKLMITPVLISSDVSSPFLDDVSSVIRKNLQADDYFIINDRFPRDERITFNSYITGRCVTELAKVIPGGVLILVAVRKGEVKVGEKQHSRYVVEDIIETRYTIYVSTVDLSAGRYDLKFRETVNDPGKLTDEADTIGQKIREFYISKKTGGDDSAVRGIQHPALYEKDHGASVRIDAAVAGIMINCCQANRIRR